MGGVVMICFLGIIIILGAIIFFKILDELL